MAEMCLLFIFLVLFNKIKRLHFKVIIIQDSMLTDDEDISSVQFSRPVMSDSLRPHESQHTRPPCPSPTPGVYSNSCLLSW